MRLWVDKIASSTRNVPLRREIRVVPEITADEGYIVAARACGEKSVYNQLEDVYGRMVTLHDGDVIVGVLGHRNALHGYSGVVPKSIAVGQRLQVLNLGGVIGQCTSANVDVGPPLDVEILGAVLTFPDFENRCGLPAHIRMNAIPCERGNLPDVPVVFVAGTCMNSGKTSAACRLVRQLAIRGKAVGACKLTGVSLRRDTLQMSDYGANGPFRSPTPASFRPTRKRRSRLLTGWSATWRRPGPRRSSPNWATGFSATTASRQSWPIAS